MKNSIASEKAFAFSIEILKLYKVMVEQKDFFLSKQIVRSATSIGANINEALAGQSKKDFISKMSISSKEARETGYWLELSKVSKFIDYDLDPLIVKTSQSK